MSKIRSADDPSSKKENDGFDDNIYGNIKDPELIVILKTIEQKLDAIDNEIDTKQEFYEILKTIKQELDAVDENDTKKESKESEAAEIVEEEINPQEF